MKRPPAHCKGGSQDVEADSLTLLPFEKLDRRLWRVGESAGLQVFRHLESRHADLPVGHPIIDIEAIG